MITSGEKRAKLAENMINHLHLDYIPYTYLIVSLPKTADNEKLMDDIKNKFGIL